MGEMPAWMEGIKEDKLEKAVQAGEILPQLPLPTIPPGKTSSDETLFVKMVELPKKVTGENIPQGEMWVAAVEHQGAKKSLIIPNSLRFNMAKECKLNELDSPVGHWFVIGAHLADTVYGKATKLYWCQYKKRQLEEAESYEETQRQTLPQAQEQPAQPEPKAEEKGEASASPSPAKQTNFKTQEQKDAESFMDIDVEKPPKTTAELFAGMPKNRANLDRVAVLNMLRKKESGFSENDIFNELKEIGLTKEQVETEWAHWQDIGVLWEYSPGIFKII